MADSFESAPEPVEGELVQPAGGEPADLRQLPVPGVSRPSQLGRTITVSVPATLAAAAGGFLLGIVSFVLVRLVRRPAPGLGLAPRRDSLRGPEIESTRSFLVDVHVLKR